MTFRRMGVLLGGLAALALGCNDDKSSNNPPTPECTRATGGMSTVSNLPLPASCAVAQPAGAAGNLQVLPWAGFKGAVSFTFDDAVGSQLRNYEILKAPGVRLTFYIAPIQVNGKDPEGNDLLPLWKNVLADGHEIGSHTVNHCHVDGSNPAVVDPANSQGCAWGDPAPEQMGTLVQITAANDFVKDVIGQKDALGRPAIWTMATPYGDGGYAPYAQEAGLLASRDVWMDGASRSAFLKPGDVSEMYHLPTWAGGGASGGWGIDTSQETFEKLVNDARGRGGWTTILFHDVTPDAAPRWDPPDYGCCAVPAANIAGALEHLKTWGDVWGDSVVNVASYTIAQNLFASLTAVDGAGGAKTWTWTLPANYPPGKYLRVSVSGGTLTQRVGENTVTLPWNERGFYEVDLSAGNLTLTP